MMMSTVLLFCGVHVLQIYKRVPRGKSCIHSMYEAQKFTLRTMEVAVPKMLVLLFGVDMPHVDV